MRLRSFFYSLTALAAVGSGGTYLAAEYLPDDNEAKPFFVTARSHFMHHTGAENLLDHVGPPAQMAVELYALLRSNGSDLAWLSYHKVNDAVTAMYEDMQTWPQQQQQQQQQSTVIAEENVNDGVASPPVATMSPSQPATSSLPKEVEMNNSYHHQSARDMIFDEDGKVKRRLFQ
eukprot:PhM_4_TR471/c0_g1_i1/m.27511